MSRPSLLGATASRALGTPLMTRRTRSAVIAVGVVLTLDENELAIAAILSVQRKHGMGSCAGAGKRIQYNSFIGASLK